MLKISSVAGRKVCVSLIKAIYPVKEETEKIEEFVQQAVAVGILVTTTGIYGTEYQFKHITIQEVLYDRLLFSQKHKIHLMIAKNFENSCAAMQDNYIAIAHHYSSALHFSNGESSAENSGGGTSESIGKPEMTELELAEKCIHYLSESAKVSSNNNVYEAEACLTKALDIVEKHLPTEDDQQKERKRYLAMQLHAQKGSAVTLYDPQTAQDEYLTALELYKHSDGKDMYYTIMQGRQDLFFCIFVF
jgi:hypothetical protein